MKFKQKYFCLNCFSFCNRIVRFRICLVCLLTCWNFILFTLFYLSTLRVWTFQPRTSIENCLLTCWNLALFTLFHSPTSWVWTFKCPTSIETCRFTQGLDFLVCLHCSIFQHLEFNLFNVWLLLKLAGLPKCSHSPTSGLSHLAHLRCFHRRPSYHSGICQWFNCYILYFLSLCLCLCHTTQV